MKTHSTYKRNRIRHWGTIFLISLMFPMLLLSAPSWLGSWLVESLEQRSAEKKVERIERDRRAKPFTDMAAPQRTAPAWRDDAPHLRVAKLPQTDARKADVPSRAAPRDPVPARSLEEFAEFEAETGFSNERPVRLAQAPPVLLPPHLTGGRKVPRPTRVIAEPELWPEERDPFVKPSMQVDPSRYGRTH